MRQELEPAERFAYFERRYDPLELIIRKLDLQQGLELCLDVGDVASYPGSGQVWYDRSPNGYNFNRGADANASTDDPTFNGMSGGLSALDFFGFDGGDNLTLGQSNPAWINGLHQDNALGTLVTAIYTPSSVASISISGTRGAAAGHTGFSWSLGASTPPGPEWQVRNAGTLVVNQSSALRLVYDKWNIVGISINEALGANGIIYMVNGSTDTDTATYSSPASGDASYAMQIGASGNAFLPFASGMQMSMFAGWSVALSANSMIALWQILKRRFAHLAA